MLEDTGLNLVQSFCFGNKILEIEYIGDSSLIVIRSNDLDFKDCINWVEEQYDNN